MEFKQQPLPTSTKRTIWRPYVLIIGTFCISCLICAMIGLGLLKRASPHRYQQFLTAVSQTPGALVRYIKHSQADMPIIHLNVKHLNLQKMAFERHQFFMEEKDIDFQFVAGSLLMDQKKVPINIRLKGDRYIHISDPHKWSFRIHIKGEESLLGMKYFSLHRAGARNYLYEWLFHRLLKKEGFVALRYEFVEVQLNGKSLGVYAMEEHFDKRLIEHRQFREGPILKFDEDLTGDVLNMSVSRPFRQKQWTSPEQKAMLERASSLLEHFRRGEAGIAEVFDLDKMATFFAITDVLSVRHGSFWKSIRFYYNPLSDRLEPIGFDGHFQPEVAPGFFLAAQSSQRPHIPFHREGSSWYDHVFFPKDTVEPVFFAAYIQALQRFSEGEYIDHFWEEVEDELSQNLSRIYSDYPTEADHLFWYGPDMHFFSNTFFYEKKQFIQTELHPFKHMVLAFQDTLVDRTIHLEVTNVHTLPQQVKTLYIDSLTVPLPTPHLLLPRALTDFISYTPGYQRISIKLPAHISWHDSLWHSLRLGYSVLGISKEQITQLAPWRREVPFPHPQSLMHAPANQTQFPFINTDVPNKQIVFQSGSWELTEDLILPKGFRIVMGPKTKLDLLNGASILSHSPLIWQGSNDSPIRLLSSDSSGQGIFVFQADSSSRLSHVIFSQLSPPRQASWGLSGAVSFYESDVLFEDVHWQSCRGEDGLNLIRSTFELSHCYFDESESDALDIDFCVGEIRECWLRNSGNDALDISGSTVLLAGLTISRAGDKGISIGEDSRVEAHQLFIGGSRTGMAIKDHSSLNATQVRLDSCQTGWALYEKKSEYGPATASLQAVVHKALGTPYLIERGSTCLLNAHALPATEEAVRQKVDDLVVSEK
ncbi:MAG: CotH kinase family protein [Bacteroidota bacterium]